jgi:hypothetical protein
MPSTCALRIRSAIIALVLFLAMAAQTGCKKAHNQSSASAWADPATGLMWAKHNTRSDSTWQEANDYCASLRTGGYSDWRLPSIGQLESIYTDWRSGSPEDRDEYWQEWQEGNKDAAPSPRNIRGGIRISGCLAWSLDGVPTSSWKSAFSFCDRSLPMPPGFRETGRYDADPNTLMAALCVRDAGYTAVWRDTATGLMWASHDNGNDVNWYEARDYCQNLRAGSYSDWRLPTVDELGGMYVPDSDCHRLKGGVRITDCQPWSSTTSAAGGALRFDFATRPSREKGAKGDGGLPTSLSYRAGGTALCVRSPAE